MGGGEAVVHAWRQIMEEFASNPDFIGFKIDFVNAFNSVKRDVFLKECHQRFPQIFKWVHFCYSQHSYLFFGNHIIFSQAGVQQGDPLGPFLFCLVLQVLIDKLMDKVPDLALNNWYMDDGSLFGKSDDVLRAWNIVKTEGPHLGLFSNLQKCEVISASGCTNSFQHFEPEIIRISDGNMSILGSAIGSKSHCESWVTNKLNKKLPSLINKLNSLDHAQSSFLLLLFCASFCKMVWYIRTMPPDLLSDSCVHFDEIIIQGFENILGCGLPVFSLSQVCLSTKLGGAGLRASKTHSAAAYLSSFFASSSLVETFLRKPCVSIHITSALLQYNQQVSTTNQIHPPTAPTSQKDLSFAIDSECFNTLASSSNLLNKARILCCAAPHAGAWIRALPFLRNRLSNLEWSISMKRWLGIPVFEKEHVCVACNKEAMDIFGNHAIVCSTKGDRIKRHNAIRDCFFDFCSAAAWGPVKEKPFLLPGSCERPADILIPNYSAGKDLAVDFAVTCPLQSAYLHEAANTSLYACNKYAEDIKLAKFQNCVQLEGLDYLPFVFESFGGLSMDTESFISKLATSISHRFGDSRHVVLANIFQNVACILNKSIARSISSRFPDFSLHVV